MGLCSSAMWSALLLPETLVRDVLMRVPGAPRGFARHRVDYCCHGALTVAEASARVDADPAAVLAALAEEAARPDAEPPWGDSFEHMPLAEVVAHLAEEVHPQCRRDVAALRAICPAAGPVARAIAQLCDELDAHLAFEERYLFPYVVALEQTNALPIALFDTVYEPCQMLLREHESADHGLDALRALTDDYRPPPDADVATRDLYATLADYDRALVRHMHLEGNVLFPRAQRLEDRVRAAYDRQRRRR